MHEEQRISGFVHGLKTKSLLEFLSTYLPTTYKGLMEKTYTWIEAKEVATNGAPTHHREGFNRFNKGSSWDNNKGRNKDRDKFSPYKGSNHRLLANLSKSLREILATEKAAKGFKQPPRMRDKDIVPAESPILVISRENHIHKRKFIEEPVDRIGEITFPLCQVLTIPMILLSSRSISGKTSHRHTWMWYSIDSRSFLIPCTLGITIMYNALANLGASINLMSYSLYVKLSGDLVILEMEEDSKVPFILGRPFLYSADAIIRVKGKELNLGVGNERITFMINKAM
ncbi:hypothetical protein Tco_0879211 [Tanacetum coccineum]